MKAIAKWKKERSTFLYTITIIALVFYMSLPLLIAYFPKEMSEPSIVFSISRAWIYAFFQVGMTWVFGWVYWVKAKQLDKLVLEIEKEAAK